MDLKSHVLGTSVEGRSLSVYELVNNSPVILVLGGMHGDEPTSAAVAEFLLDLVRTSVGDMMDEHLVLIPRVNPDGLEHGTRHNAAGIDLNRNFPTTNWKRGAPGEPYFGGERSASEPETKMLLDVFRRYTPRRVLSIHAIDDDRYCINYDGPAEPLAQLMSKENGYAVKADIGYATPGSFGTWCGFERKLPTITLELPADEDGQASWQRNRDAILSFIQAEF